MRPIKDKRLTGLLWILIATTLLYGEGPEKKKESIPIPEGQELVRIIPFTESVILQSNPQSDVSDQLGLLSSTASIRIAVQSYLPEWGVTVEMSPLCGSDGDLPLERIYVRTEETGGAFLPLTSPVPVVKGDLRLPEKESVFEIAFKQLWKDPPGYYQGNLILKPFLPGMEDSKTQHSRIHKKDNLRLTRHVRVSLTIEEIIQISITSHELKFTADRAPGEYRAEPDMHFQVATNARQWHVMCQETDLISGEGTIPSTRINWQQLNETGQVQAEGNLGMDNVILSGGKISEKREIIMRFTIKTTIEDPAGIYQGRISLTGITGF